MQSPSSNILNDVDFAQEIARVKHALRGYIFSLLTDYAATEEVFQDTILVLWEKRGDFSPGTNFRAWALSVARFKILTRRRNAQREMKIAFSDALFDRLEAESEKQASLSEERLDALHLCIEQLTPADVELLRRKYFFQENITKFSRETNKNANTFHKALSRIRMRLKICIDKRTKQQP